MADHCLGMGDLSMVQFGSGRRATFLVTRRGVLSYIGLVSDL